MKAKEIYQNVKSNFKKSDKPIPLTASNIKRKATIKRSGGGCCMKG
ncbi:hypothetical protein [Gracilibacillus xinjiangensis]|uniref:Mersacidin/lichenicidin family type 2 lantibiotic n=1 Tax=Gracilibacillus xinjiangensis TaxID=1193282 RepID=A0ABV8WXA7_9BACI